MHIGTLRLTVTCALSSVLIASCAGSGAPAGLPAGNPGQASGSAASLGFARSVPSIALPSLARASRPSDAVAPAALGVPGNGHWIYLAQLYGNDLGVYRQRNRGDATREPEGRGRAESLAGLPAGGQLRPAQLAMSTELEGARHRQSQRPDVHDRSFSKRVAALRLVQPRRPGILCDAATCGVMLRTARSLHWASYGTVAGELSGGYVVTRLEVVGHVEVGVAKQPCRDD